MHNLIRDTVSVFCAAAAAVFVLYRAHERHWVDENEKRSPLIRYRWKDEARVERGGGGEGERREEEQAIRAVVFLENKVSKSKFYPCISNVLIRLFQDKNYNNYNKDTNQHTSVFT